MQAMYPKRRLYSSNRQDLNVTHIWESAASNKSQYLRGKLCHSVGDRHIQYKRLDTLLQGSWRPYQEGHTCVVLMVHIRHHILEELYREPDAGSVSVHGVRINATSRNFTRNATIAAGQVYNAAHHLCIGLPLIHLEKVRCSVRAVTAVRAVRAVRSSCVFLMESRFLADAWPTQCLSFQNTPDNLHNFVIPLWASFLYLQLYHNANAWDVDSFSTPCDGTKWQQQSKVDS